MTELFKKETPMKGEYDKAVAALVRCPMCGAMNLPDAKPTLEPEPDGRLTCTVCSLNFRPGGKR